jgi:1-carboxybiuret hydrolase subunit AtzG-like
MDEQYVIEAARRLGLELDPVRRRAVLGNLQRIEQLARPVLELELAPEEEAGPPWTP